MLSTKTTMSRCEKSPNSSSGGGFRAHVPLASWDPSFSYHATASSLAAADSASTSPSPSTSIAKTD